MASNWCILRTSGRGTLRLTASLNREGIEAWTPSVMIERPGGREKPTAIMPTFVFAKAVAIPRLALLEERPRSHEPFSFFRHFGALPVVADCELEPLRSAENRAAPKRRQRSYRPGQIVRVPEGSFSGMTGRVEETEGKFTLVCFGGSIRVRIATFLLRDDVLDAAA